MSNDELEPIEGTIVDDAPFTDPAEAQQFMSRALNLLRDGVDTQLEAQRLLTIAAAREIWKPLGFDNWEDCLTAGVSETFVLTMTKAARTPLILQMRTQGVSTVNIAKAIKTSTPTVNRELQALRASGDLVDEPTKVVGEDGRARPTSLPKPAAARRAPFDKSWLSAVDGLRARIVTLRNLHGDDRFAGWAPDLSARTRYEFQLAHDLITAILADFDKVPPARIQEP